MGELVVDDGAFARALTIHQTVHSASAEVDGRGDMPGPSIQAVFRDLVEDEARTGQICADIAAASRAGRNCLVLSQWTEHLARLKAQLEVLGLQPDLLQGGVGKKARRLITDRLVAARSGDGVTLLATGSFLGEGFDCPPLDTLFLAFPIAFKGRLVQYIGRVLRPIDGKTRVEVHDYVDIRVPMLARMHTKRLAAYATLGFDIRAKASGRVPRSGRGHPSGCPPGPGRLRVEWQEPGGHLDDHGHGAPGEAPPSHPSRAPHRARVPQELPQPRDGIG